MVVFNFQSNRLNAYQVKVRFGLDFTTRSGNHLIAHNGSTRRISCQFFTNFRE